MDMQELPNRVEIILSTLMVGPKRYTILQGSAALLVVEDFGLVACCMDRVDYTEADGIISKDFPGWRKVFITPHEDMVELRYKLLYALMRGGYMRWLRSVYPRQVKNILTGPDNLGNRIIKERLRIWNNKPMYKFLIEDNESVLRNGILAEFSVDPGFFDHMPEGGD